MFFLHGMLDTLIPYHHSEEMNAVCPMISYLHLVSDMDHNEFKLMEDLVLPFKKFISSLDGVNLRKPDRTIKLVKANIQGNQGEEHTASISTAEEETKE